MDVFTETIVSVLPRWTLLFNDPIVAAEITADLELGVDRLNDTPAATYSFSDFNHCHLCVRQERFDSIHFLFYQSSSLTLSWHPFHLVFSSATSLFDFKGQFQAAVCRFTSI